MNKDTIEIDLLKTTVAVEPLSNLNEYWKDSGRPLDWDCLFVLPPWLGAWWSYFGKDPETRLYVARQGDTIVGIAPLVVSGDMARLVSDTDLIDYSDFIIAPSKERVFFPALFEQMMRENIRYMDMPRVRADSSTISYLQAYSPDDWELSFAPVDVFYEMDLPETWEGYLDSLSSKERHEIRRKLRRLESAGRTGLRIISDSKDVPGGMDAFVKLFRSNRIEKKQFMTEDMESFFRSLAVGMADSGLLKLFFLDIDGVPAAVTMCFEYQSSVYLYNNGYDLRFSHLSVGLMSKVFSMRESIKLGRAKYNFLRGGETYKGRLGGRPVSLLHCGATLK